MTADPPGGGRVDASYARDTRNDRTVVFASGYAAGQRQPPTSTVGQSQEMLRSLDLTGEIYSVQGRLLRMRKITLQPGGAFGIHDHVNRPAIT